MIYNDLIDDIKSADYVLFGLGKEIYSSDDTEIYDNLKKLVRSGIVDLMKEELSVRSMKIMLKKRRNSGISTINGCHPHLQRSWLLWNWGKIFLTLML